MSELAQLIEAALASFENESVPFNENDVESRLRSCIPTDLTEIPEEIRGDLIAFALCENAEEHSSGWELYFGPKTVLRNEDGSFSEYPGRSSITETVISSWEKRAKTINSPVLKARYASLVWVFCPQVLNRPPGAEFAQIAIDANIQVSRSHNYKHEVYLKEKLEWALSLSMSIRDTTRRDHVITAVIELENRIAEDNKAGLWGFSFDLLLFNKKIELPRETEEIIIKDLEDRLARIVGQPDVKSVNPWAAESAATRLAKYYKSKNMVADLRRVLGAYSSSFQGVIDKAAPLQALIWTQQVSKLFLDFGIRDESDRMLAKIKDIGPKVKDDLKEIRVETKIPKEVMDEYINQMTLGTIDECLARLVFRFLPDKCQVENQLLKNSKQFVFQHIIPRNILDHKGRTIAVVGTINDDFPGHVVLQTSQNMSISAYFLRLSIQSICERKSANVDEFTSFILNSPFFDPSKRPILERGIKAYFENDQIVAIHLLIPQIEDAIRTVVEECGGTAMKINRNNHCLQAKLFDELLREQIVTTVFGEDWAWYFRILFTDSRGWNVRNSVCHGLSSIDTFSIQVSDRVIHALLFLGMFRKKSPTSGSSGN